MSTFETVALLGKGLLGSATLPALVDAGFTVTVLSRSEKNKEGLPAGVKYTVVDYSSIDSLEAAFRGQDVVVSTIGGFEGLAGQKLMIDAAIKAGVKRFIPSDFSSMSTDPAVAHLIHYVGMVDIQNYIKAKAEAGLIEYSIFTIGVFTEYLVKFGFAVDWANKSAEVWNGGITPMSTTSLAGTGKAIAGALKNPDATKNRIVYVHEFVVTQKHLLDLTRKYAPSEDWKLTTIDDPEAEFQKREKLANEKPGMDTIISLLRAQMLSGKFQGQFPRVDNDIVGLKLLSEVDFDAAIARDCK
ncbi:hypothetical protein N0V90_011306 [Kalmusia sp. IMI 367209]|nr:hypothetical protein N0V90_011306 [Kalmusia sp. IMI 367209]